MKQPQTAFIGVCSGFGQKRAGVDLGPQLMREDLKSDRFTDFGDIHEFHTQHSDLTKRAWNVITKLEKRAIEALSEHETLLTIGGDHSIAAGTISATLHHHPDARVVYMDAHGDINTPGTSPTGNLHGMPLAAVLGLFESPLANRNSKLKPENLFFIGVRDLDEGEKEIIARHKIEIITANDIRLNKRAALMKFKFWLRKSSEPVHFSFDVDALDPESAKATGIHVVDGLSPAEAKAFARLLQREAKVIAVDLVELNPSVTTKQEVERTLRHIESILKEIHFVKKLYGRRWLRFSRRSGRALGRPKNVTSRRVFAN